MRYNDNQIIFTDMAKTNQKQSYERPSLDTLSLCHNQVLMASSSFVSDPSATNESFGSNGSLTEFEW